MIKQSDNIPSEVFQLEAAIDALISGGKSVITLQDVLTAAPAVEAEALEAQKAQITRELNYHDALLPVIPGEKYQLAADLFTNAEFLIVPDGFEIENNILIPGHRFVPFMDQELFPSEISLKEAGARKRQSVKEFSGVAENIIKYHLLMGAETLFDFFAAEAEENMDNARSSANPTLKLTVLDMQKFYAETNFTEGDALLVKVVDYHKGEFEFRLDNGKARGGKKATQYRAKLEKTLESVT